jgi:hypothetical protein
MLYFGDIIFYSLRFLKQEVCLFHIIYSSLPERIANTVNQAFVLNDQSPVFQYFNDPVFTLLHLFLRS